MAWSTQLPIPVVDIFAGPGGLGEGFSSFFVHGKVHPFRVRLSVEKDAVAHQTLLLRSFFRQFPRDQTPEDYYRYLRGEIERNRLFANHPEAHRKASAEALCAELGKTPQDVVSHHIEDAVNGAAAWVLIGGPPCQAYSMVGRSRMAKVRAKTPDLFEANEKHHLYREYLQILAEHAPPVFILENVKGILSSTIKGERIFDRIEADLKNPAGAQGVVSSHPAFSATYKLHSLCQKEVKGPHAFIVESERYGVPQCRHRVIILGVRSDLAVIPPSLLSREEVTLRDVIGSLPRLRSGLSRGEDTGEAWLEVVKGIAVGDWTLGLGQTPSADLLAEARRTIKALRLPIQGLGARFIPCKVKLKAHIRWFKDANLHGICQHTARFHIASDLERYFFAACYAKTNGRSPDLRDYPAILLPNHKNAAAAVKDGTFDDRFRVQLWERPSTTVVSHLRKDGYYFIHPDPNQCRSITPREAARLQTFPDNYFFEGPRTAQYEQIGNAVPPLLAREIARVVWGILEQAGKGNEVAHG